MSKKTAGGADAKKLKAENARLKAENSRLKGKSTKTLPRRKFGWARSTGVIFFIALSVALVISANLLFWFGNTIVKPDRFQAATQPVIKDPAVQNAVALYTTNSIFNNLDVQKTTESVLPPKADFLAPQLTAQLKTFTKTALQKALAKPKFQDKWNQILARQHQRIITFATKYQGDGDISLNDVFNQLTAQLSNTKLAFLAGKKLPPKAGDITLVSAPNLPKFHKLIVNIDTWRTISLILLVLFMALATWLSRNRRRVIYIFSLATAVLMVVTILAVHVLINTVAGKVDPQYTDGARRAAEILFHSLITQTSTIMGIAIFIGAVTWVSSSSRRAVASKAWLSQFTSGKAHNRLFSKEHPWNKWVASNKRLLEWGVVAFWVLVMLGVRLTLKGLVVYAALIIIMVLGVEIISGQQEPVKSNGPAQL